MLDAGTGDTNGVNFLEGIVADQAGRYLARENNQRNRVHVRGRNTGDRIGCTGAGGNQHHAGLSGRARVAIGRMGRCLLMTHQDVFDLFLLVQRIIDMQYRTTRVAEQVFDTLIAQATDKNLGTGQFHLSHPPKIVIG